MSLAIGKGIFELMQRLDYQFYDITKLENAMTHASYANEQRSRGIVLPSNERLEFLGDAVLQLVVSEYLYTNFKKYTEGVLTRIRQSLVCEKTLSRVAKRLGLGAYLHLGHGEELTDCRERPKVLADALEALFGALYLDSLERGGDEYKKIILTLLEPELLIADRRDQRDHKTLLQQLVEKDGSASLVYEVTKEEGPEHQKRFTVTAKVNNNAVGVGEGCSIKEAEMNSAAAALALFGISI